MKAYNGFESKASNGGSYEQLPAGAYVAVIKNVKIDGTEPDQTLILRVDITEGEYANYFTNRYRHDSEGAGRFPVKYKGDFRLRIPNDQNTKALYPASDRRRFEDAIWRIEQSNPGYRWSWDEKSLIGKAVGINMQEGEYNGTPYTTIGRLEVVSDVRSGAAKPMKPRKPRSDASSVQVTTSDTVPDGFSQVEEELPF